MRDKYESLLDYICLKWQKALGKPVAFEGCSQEELNQIKKSQNVERLPKLYEHFMLRFGRNSGGLLSGVEYEYRFPHVLEFRELGVAPIKFMNPEYSIKKNQFVFMADYHASFLYFEINSSDDPQVFTVYEDNSPNYFTIAPLGSFSFRLVDGIEENINNLKLRKKITSS